MTSPTDAPHRVWPNPNKCTADCGNFDELTALRLQRHRLLARLTKAAAPAGLDVERLARWLHEARVGCSTDVCDPTPALYVGVSRTMHETDARDILAAAYAEGEPE